MFSLKPNVNHTSCFIKTGACLHYTKCGTGKKKEERSAHRHCPKHELEIGSALNEIINCLDVLKLCIIKFDGLALKPINRYKNYRISFEFMAFRFAN